MKAAVRGAEATVVAVTVAGAQGVARGRVRTERAEAEATGRVRTERVEAEATGQAKPVEAG